MRNSVGKAIRRAAGIYLGAQTFTIQKLEVFVNYPKKINIKLTILSQAQFPDFLFKFRRGRGINLKNHAASRMPE